ncbi:MAG TPA: DUF2520 domain-containing protein [Solirubrobacteraceae bacterium]
MNHDWDSKPTAGPRHARGDGAPLASERSVTPRVAIVGAGRLGNALALALAAAGIDVAGPLGREDTPPRGVDAVLLCVPDDQIAIAAASLSPRSPSATAGAVPRTSLRPSRAAPQPAAAASGATTASPSPSGRPGPLVGHCSAATTLAALHPHEAFSLHPLMTATDRGATFAGATAAIAGSTPRALAFAGELASALGMYPVRVADDDRAAYHAAASIASNFLVTLQGVAERLAATAGIDREQLVALVRASVENWAAVGGPAALTGPIARGDEHTVRLQRGAVADRAPQDLELFDALAAATRRLAAERMAPA